MPKALEIPVRVTGMEEVRAALAEIKAGAADLVTAGLTVNVNIYTEPWATIAAGGS